MSEIILPSSLSGEVNAVASKSYAHRLLICAALSKEPSSIICRNKCDDVMSTIRCLNALGAEFEGTSVIPIDRNKLPLSPQLDCGESGSSLRFLLPIVAALGCGGEFVMCESLAKRPMKALTDELERHGADIIGNRIYPSRILGKTFNIPGDVSSQYISGLLMALPLMGGGIVNITSELQSSKYVDITIDCLHKSSIYVNRIGSSLEVSGEYDLQGIHVVEGDCSSAAFWLCAGVMGKNKVSVCGLNPCSIQGDRRVVEILKTMGAKLEFSEDISTVTAYPSALCARDIDASEVPDLIPVLSVVCAAAEGESRIYNAKRLRIKESDRLHAINVMLTSLGADVTELEDALIIRGGKKLNGGKVQSFSDHRIVMSAAVASVLCDGAIEIDDFDCIGKSYPDFKHDFLSLGGKIYEPI